MSRIKGKNTGPELVLRSFLHNNGFRFRIHDKDLIGKPDIVLPKYKTAIFVHGCFWHRHPGCRYAYVPKSRKKFWDEKFESNIKRFNLVQKTLKKNKWKIIVVWECEVSTENKLRRLLNHIQQ